MENSFLFVDFENVGDVDLSALPPETRVVIFVGGSQKSVSVDLLMATQHLQRPPQVIKMQGNGKNALDFHLAFYLGKFQQQSPSSKYIILSKDVGFDPLVSHLCTLKTECVRISSVTDFPAGSTGSSEAHFKRTHQVLSKIHTKLRPAKRKALTEHVANIFKKENLSNADVKRIIDQFFAKKLITASSNVLSYHF